MKFTRIFAGVGFSALGLIAGGALVYTLRPAQVKVLNGPDDLPVLVRGGSMEFFSGGKWSPVSGATTSSGYVWAYQTTGLNAAGVDVTDVSMDGVEPFGSNSAQLVTATAKTNWIIELSFRDNGASDNEDPTYNLQLCTSFPCSATGSFSASNPLYLVDKSKKGMFHPKSVNEMFDTFYRLAYDLPQCAGTADSTDPHCDHIKKIKVSGLSFQNANQVVVNDPFTCRGGACEIGFGKQ